MGKRECFYCDDTGFIKGKEVRPDDRLPEQICPYCEIGQAVHRGYKKAEETQLGNYDALKQSHEKLLKYPRHLDECEKWTCQWDALIFNDDNKCTCGLEQALKSAEEIK